jgi:hypothetical protein
MIVRDKRETYDGGWRLVRFETGPDGTCAPRLASSDFDEQIDTFYAQRVDERTRLTARLLAGEISPVAFFMEYWNMDVKDTAARMRLRPSAVRKHMTARGFERVRVETLKRYARVFDIAVADFFQFLRLPEGIDAEVRNLNDRLVQQVAVAVRP